MSATTTLPYQRSTLSTLSLLHFHPSILNPKYVTNTLSNMKWILLNICGGNDVQTTSSHADNICVEVVPDHAYRYSEEEQQQHATTQGFHLDEGDISVVEETKEPNVTAQLPLNEASLSGHEGYTESCSICIEDLDDTTKMFIALDCISICNSCFAQWLETQIKNGKSLDLKCPCTKHPLNFKAFSPLLNMISAEAREILVNKTRNNALPVNTKEYYCPECSDVYHLDARVCSYECLNTRCITYGAPICCKHNVVYTRANRLMEGGRFIGKRSCRMCLEESGGDGAVVAVMNQIQDAFCDKCPSCGGTVGEPSSFDDCMCLVCNHCSKCFCGFCYNYGNDWQRTHHHVRECASNPRVNYYVESEAVWRDLMRKRRISIAESIVENSGLTMEQRTLLMDRAMELL